MIRPTDGIDVIEVNPTGLVVLCVDDEPSCLDEIKYLLQGNSRVRTILTATHASPALNLLQNMNDGGAGFNLQHSDSPIDIIFLDITMPGLDGLDLARMFGSLRNPPALVFVTGYAEHAFDAFKLGAFDYIEKPPVSSRVDRALRLAQLERAGETDVKEPDDTEVIPVELGGTTRLVQRASVRYVEAQGDYARLHTDEGSHLIRRPLSDLEEQWADVGFTRIHRSYLVALNLITELRSGASGHTVLLGTGDTSVELPVSRRHTRELKDRLMRRKDDK